MKAWYSIQAKSSGSADIRIYDEIGMWGITAKQFSDELSAVGQVNQIDLHIHSPGGDVFDGIAIYNLLNKHPAQITVYIDGLAASMASVIAMAGDKVVMPENAMMMIHKPWGISGGNANEMRDYADLLDKVEGVLIPAYASKTGKSTDELSSMLEGETWLNGRECVEQGFADELLPALNAMARMESKRIEDFVHMPNGIKGMITTPKGTVTTQHSTEQLRINGIKDLFAMFGGKHHGLQTECVEDAGCTIDQAKDRLLALMGKNATPSQKSTNAGHIHAGNGNFTGDGIRNALNARIGHCEASKDNPYNTMSLFEMAKASLVERGVGISSLGSRNQIVGLAFTHSSSDFGHILAGGAETSVLKGWQDSAETFQQWTKSGNLPNFREAKRVGLNGFKTLDKVSEGAEYKYVTTDDKGVPIALATYGNIFSITRQAIINDDLQQLTTIPQAMGRAAARTVGDLVYAILTSNVKFTDNNPLFDDIHKNLIAGAPDFAGMVNARAAMRLQEDEQGNTLNVVPAFILVPAALEAQTLQTILSTSTTNAPNSGVRNPANNMGQIIVEPRLDKHNNKEWYVMAAQGSDTVEVAYLDGMDTPYLEQQEGFTVDGVAYKVRIDAGVAALDYRGLVKSSGA
ncbi:peptidase [Hafnia paralvei]|uniref:ATP-dependent Clp protease proteolytic subunit n=1 Tax=Hafnia paralvei TaxID=546367 RepID=A0A2A2MBG0_9GAMM|nr:MULTISPECIES: ClpP-like prohead protease/major capsid protein fusion protein [Hafnia]PAV95622.1 peptidase [Hafnia paralvei]